MKERLWRFGPTKNRVCCYICFQKKFTDFPRKTLSESVHESSDCVSETLSESVHESSDCVSETLSESVHETATECLQDVKQRKSWPEFISECRDVPYSDYVAYMNKKKGDIIDVMFNETNYLRGIKLLASPRLREISKTLTKKQNQGLYEMARFLGYNDVIKDCTKLISLSKSDFAFLLINSKE